MNKLHLEEPGASLQRARETGKKLNEIKALAGRGNWLSVLKAKTPISPRQAQKYLRIFNYWKLLPPDYDFTIDQAYDYIGERL